MDALVNSGQYRDYSELIASSVANLSVLQDELSSSGSIVIGTDSQSEASMSAVGRPERAGGKKSTVRRPAEVATMALPALAVELDGEGTRATRVIPPLFTLEGLDQHDRPELAPQPSDVWVRGQEVPLDRWIFGQYNKLLPAKANVRALAHLQAREARGVPLGEAASRIVEEVVALGALLARRDEINGTNRDDALATAFPTSDTDSEKGRSRYANQFVASVNTQGRVSGLLIDFKFINYYSGRKGSSGPRLQLTEAGWELALLRNPVLDEADGGSSGKFSPQEVAFLTRHIARCVRAEDFAYRAILTAVDEGANTPEMLDAALRRFAPERPGRALSESFLSSQRSGAVSRMADLGLLARVREGVRVSYVATDAGKRYAQGAQ